MSLTLFPNIGKSIIMGGVQNWSETEIIGVDLPIFGNKF
jgi:hypothetical protein